MSSDMTPGPSGGSGPITETDPTAVKSVNGKGPGAVTLNAGDVGATTQAQAAAAAPVQAVATLTGSPSASQLVDALDAALIAKGYLKA